MSTPAPATPPGRMDAVQSPIIQVVGQLIRQTPGTISLGQGVVHYGPPPAALNAVRAGLADPAIHQYCPGSGLPALRDQIALKLAADNGITIGGRTAVLVTAGANLAFMHAIMAVTVPGDDVLLPVPFYFNHDMAVAMAGCRVVPVPTGAAYQLDLAAIEAAITPRARAVVTVSPNNPTGAVFDRASLRGLGELCRARGLVHISDETYEYFTYGEARHLSPAGWPEAADHTIALYSLSKAYGFAGWRIGYMTFPEWLTGAMLKSQDTLLICPPVASQIAAAVALQAGRTYCDPYLRELAIVRNLVLTELAALSPRATVTAADGAFYCLLKIEGDADAVALNERLITEHKVAVIPGTAFGITQGCYLRVAYGALQRETVQAGIGRLVSGLRALLS